MYVVTIIILSRQGEQRDFFSTLRHFPSARPDEAAEGRGPEPGRRARPRQGEAVVPPVGPPRAVLRPVLRRHDQDRLGDAPDGGPRRHRARGASVPVPPARAVGGQGGDLRVVRRRRAGHGGVALRPPGARARRARRAVVSVPRHPESGARAELGRVRARRTP